MYLNCHSQFSLRYGTFSVDDLVATAEKLGIRALALTDINAVSGVFDFVRACEARGIKPIVGIECRSGDELAYLCLARHPEGFAQINRHVSEVLAGARNFPRRAPALSGVVVVYPLSRLDSVTDLQAHEYIGVRPAEVTRLWRYRQRVDRSRLLVLQPVTYPDREKDKTGFNLHKLLRAIDLNCLGSRLHERTTIRDDEAFLSPTALEYAFLSYPEIVVNTKSLLDDWPAFTIDFHSPKNRKHFTTAEKDDVALLHKLTYDGFYDRYGQSADAKARIERELTIIEELKFTAYFLITWDIIRYARSRGYFHIGRGSGANSIVAYCMGITVVDPIELDLYFERFINPSRTSPPDFDIDFSWDERDEIIDYIFKRYGREHVCLMGAYNTFQGRSPYRELAKVFGLPKPEIDALVNDPTAVPDSRDGRLIHRYALLLAEFPNYLSIHAGGILISEQPLYHYTVLQPMPKGFPICQWDMYVAEEIGFAKWDILSQRGLGHIKEAVDLVRQNRQVSVDIHRIQDFKRDPNIRTQLEKHETMGAFYIESPAMRQLIWKLGCNNYLTLVAASSIIRPGVASSGMMTAYIRRHHDPDSVQHIHPKMGELLRDTYGVMVYQEDVIKVAHYFAGLSLAEADVLRRAMSGKYRNRIEYRPVEDKFFANCRKFGYSEETIREVWRQIQSFANYSFSKAHSASFAVESYQSLYLKTYYPLEFMTAVINNFGGFYRTEFYVHEARRYGASIEAPDVNRSDYLARIDEKTIWLGWVLLKGLEKNVIAALLNERKKRPFAGLEDFSRRVPAGLEQLILLIRIGAFRQFGHTKKELLWQAHALAASYAGHRATEELFEHEEMDWQLPTLWQDELEDVYDEIELLGFPLRSPFELIDGPVEGIAASQLADYQGCVVVVVGYLVTYKPIRTKDEKRMAFGYFVDRENQFFDTTHFPAVLESYPFRGMGLYRVEGRAVVEYGFPSLEVLSMLKLPFKPDPRLGQGDNNRSTLGRS